MLNIVEKYSAETAVESEDGVVAIEYVVVAGALVVALAALWTAFGTTLSGKLQEIVSGIGGG
jgi:Flp pilus assembly pilin Flp